MTKINLRDRIKKGVFLLDGAMGTQLFARGVANGKCNDYLNIESPDIILGIQKSYIQAGSDAVITNTFGANRYTLNRHGLADKVEAINKAGVEIAREAAGQERYVLGDIGPSGGFLEPLGTLKAKELKGIFEEQAKTLAQAGVDGFIIETMTALDEVTITVEAVKAVTNLPVFVSLAFDTAGDDFKTMMGVSVKSAAEKIIPLRVEAIGFNCGKVQLNNYVKLAEKYVSVVRQLSQDVVLLAEPNAGLPELIDDRVIYKVAGKEFAAAVKKIHSVGFNILGGCCGTCPEHIKALAEKFKK